MKTLLCTLFAALIAVTAIQVPPAHAAKLTQKQCKEECEKAKKARNYDTPLGRAIAKAWCRPGGFSSAVYWKEFARQSECLRDTRRLCK